MGSYNCIGFQSRLPVCPGDEIVLFLGGGERSQWWLPVVGEGWRLTKLQFEAMRNGVIRVASDGKVAVGELVVARRVGKARK